MKNLEDFLALQNKDRLFEGSKDVGVFEMRAFSEGNVDGNDVLYIEAGDVAQDAFHDLGAGFNAVVVDDGSKYRIENEVLFIVQGSYNHTIYNASYIVEGASTIFNMSGVNAMVARLYQSALGREPDLAGLEYWIGRANKGLSLDNMALEFLHSNEFSQKIGDFKTLSAPEYVGAIYRNVLGRDPEQDGFNYWIEQLEKGMSRENMLARFTDSSENKVATSSWLIEKDKKFFSDGIAEGSGSLVGDINNQENIYLGDYTIDSGVSGVPELQLYMDESNSLYIDIEGLSNKNIVLPNLDVEMVNIFESNNIKVVTSDTKDNVYVDVKGSTGVILDLGADAKHVITAATYGYVDIYGFSSDKDVLHINMGNLEYTGRQNSQGFYISEFQSGDIYIANNNTVADLVNKLNEAGAAERGGQSGFVVLNQMDGYVDIYSFGQVKEVVFMGSDSYTFDIGDLNLNGVVDQSELAQTYRLNGVGVDDLMLDSEIFNMNPNSGVIQSNFFGINIEPSEPSYVAYDLMEVYDFTGYTDIFYI
jgi:hypothetical protein